MCGLSETSVSGLFHALAGNSAQEKQRQLYARHTQALEQLRTAHDTLEKRIARILINKRDRDREIVELYGKRKSAARPNGAQTARLRRLLARRHMCDRSASRFEQMAHVIERQIDELENCAATEQTLHALRGGVAASAEQTKLLGGAEAVEQLLSKFEEERDRQEEMQDAMDNFTAAHDPYERMGDEEVEDELQRLMQEERIAEQFPVEDVRAVLQVGQAPQAPCEDPQLLERPQQEIMFV